MFRLCFPVILAIVTTGCDLPPLPADGSGDEIGAWVAIQFAVEEELVSPKSADFAFGGAQKHTKYLGGGRYRIQSYVDSENVFGGTIRTEFEGVVRKQGEGWVLESLEFGG